MKMISNFIVTSLIGSSMLLSACQSNPPEPEPRYVPNISLAEATVLEVLPQRTSCDSATPMQCLLVKPENTNDDAIFGVGYNHILGFEPKIGTTYKIKVRQEIDTNNGNPTGYWRLEEILSQNISHK